MNETKPAIQDDPRTCRTCLNKFLLSENHNKACRRHPESFSGETAQRWLPPGVTKDAAVIHVFYTCCGNTDRDSPGCCWDRHRTFDEEENLEFRRPGIGCDE